MNDINEEINELGQSVIPVVQYIYFMSDIIMTVHTHGIQPIIGVCELLSLLR